MILLCFKEKILKKDRFEVKSAQWRLSCRRDEIIRKQRRPS